MEVADHLAENKRAQDAKPLRGGSALKTFEFPLRTRGEMKAYVDQYGDELSLVVFEFSGTILRRLLARGVKAVSVDLRAPEHDGPSFQGDVHEILDLCDWTMLYCIGPPCYQHLRLDHYLWEKVADCRSYWAGLYVLFWMCQPHAIVEQPDTIAADCIDESKLPGVTIVEFYTSAFGDASDKFVRMALCNCGGLEDLPMQNVNNLRRLDAAERQRRPSHLEYPDAEARDRARSSWVSHPKTADQVADVWPEWHPESADFVVAAKAFDEMWRLKGYPLPPGHGNSTGRPLDKASRDYQTVRGPGDGRRPGGLADMESLKTSGVAPGDRTRFRFAKKSGQVRFQPAPVAQTASRVTVPARVQEAAAVARPSRPARQAEPGDQEITTDQTLGFLKLMDKRTKQGRQPTDDQLERYLAIENYRASDFLFFWEGEDSAGAKSCLSNYKQPTYFKDPELPGCPTFSCMEQYVHLGKSALFKDWPSAEYMLGVRTARECRAKGRLVKDFDDDSWVTVCRQYVERGLYLKFSQDPALRAYLLGTQRRHLVEASPYDRRWGIGLKAKHAPLQTARWGSNWLGHALMRVRARLQFEQEPSMPKALEQAFKEMPEPAVPGLALAGGGQRAKDEIHSALVALDVTLRARGKYVKECGGLGNCQPLSVAESARVKGVTTLSGKELRAAAVQHGRERLESEYVWTTSGPGGNVTTRQVIEDAYNEWAANGAKVTAEEWLRRMAQDGCWGDQALLALLADFLRVDILYHVVSTEGERLYSWVIKPSDSVAPRARLELAVVCNSHYSAVLPCAANGAACSEDWGQVARDLRGGDIDPALVPTESQLAEIIEKTRELAEQLSVGVEHEAEVAPLGETMCASTSSAPSTLVSSVMDASLRTVDTEDQLRLVEGLALSQCSPHAAPEDSRLAMQAPGLLGGAEDGVQSATVSEDDFGDFFDPSLSTPLDEEDEYGAYEDGDEWTYLDFQPPAGALHGGAAEGESARDGELADSQFERLPREIVDTIFMLAATLTYEAQCRSATLLQARASGMLTRAWYRSLRGDRHVRLDYRYRRAHYEVYMSRIAANARNKKERACTRLQMYWRQALARRHVQQLRRAAAAERARRSLGGAALELDSSLVAMIAREMRMERSRRPVTPEGEMRALSAAGSTMSRHFDLIGRPAHAVGRTLYFLRAEWDAALAHPDSIPWGLPPWPAPEVDAGDVSDVESESASTDSDTSSAASSSDSSDMEEGWQAQWPRLLSERRPSHFEYADAEERDRARSSWVLSERRGQAPLYLEHEEPETHHAPRGWWVNHERGGPTAIPPNVPRSPPPSPPNSDDEEPAAPVHENATPAAGMTGQQGAETKLVMPSRLEPLRESELTGSSSLVIPYAVLEGGPVVLLPREEGAIFGLRTIEPGCSAVEAAEKGVSSTLINVAAAASFSVGTDDAGNRLVVVVTDVAPGEVAVTAAQKDELSNVATLAVWCALLALTAPSWQLSVATLAVAGVSHFRTLDGQTGLGLQNEQALRDELGFEAGRAPYLAPRREVMQGDAALTPRSLVERAMTSLVELKASLLGYPGEHASYFNLWADAVTPVALAELAPDLLDQPLGIDDPRMRLQLFPRPMPVYETPWLELAPPQQWEPRAGCEDYRPTNALALLDADAKKAVLRWFKAARKDALCLEEFGAECDRKDKPSTIAIGQDELHHCARGYVFDCRQSPCELLDYTAPISTQWNLEYLRRRFRGYPDQRLASNVLEGVRLEADLDLVSLFGPWLVSIGPGYDSVQKTVRELRDLDFYEFFMEIPYWPILFIPQGATIKKLGVKKYRRTSDFSAPHKVVRTRSGLKVVPVNEASKCYYIPEWMAHSRQAAVRLWARSKYAHVPAPTREGEVPSWKHKFPKERKPSVRDVLTAVALLLHASLLLDEPIFIWVEDAAFYFNQFGYAAEELWKSNLVVSARAEDVAAGGQKFEPGQLIFISEKRLGFGSFASSNIAQRFSNAMVGWTLEEFDRLEGEALARAPNVKWHQWIEQRRGLEDECRRRRPKVKGEALSDCTQTRLAAMYMYTDDPTAIAVGVDRTLRLLEAWRLVTGNIKVVMAGPEKRQMGAHVEWIGVCVIAAIGLLAIPKNKLLRARDALQRTLFESITYGEYRALVGLLEHLRFVTQLQADTTNALYHPHRQEQVRHEGPSAIVVPIGLMRRALHAWLRIVMQCAGAVATIVFSEDAQERLAQARAIVAASSDAAGDGRGSPGFGGYVHGFFWRVVLPPAILAFMHITGWETLAACVNILVAGRLAGEGVLLALQVDALLTPYVVSKQRSKSAAVQLIITKLLDIDKYANDLAGRLILRHLSGDGNLASDLVSRGLWTEFQVLCAALQVRPYLVVLDAAETEFVVRTIVEAAETVGGNVDEAMVASLVLRQAPEGFEVPMAQITEARADDREEPRGDHGEQRREWPDDGVSVHGPVAKVARGDAPRAAASDTPSDSEVIKYTSSGAPRSEWKVNQYGCLNADYTEAQIEQVVQDGDNPSPLPEERGERRGDQAAGHWAGPRAAFVRPPDPPLPPGFRLRSGGVARVVRLANEAESRAASAGLLPLLHSTARATASGGPCTRAPEAHRSSTFRPNLDRGRAERASSVDRVYARQLRSLHVARSSPNVAAGADAQVGQPSTTEEVSTEADAAQPLAAQSRRGGKQKVRQDSATTPADRQLSKMRKQLAINGIKEFANATSVGSVAQAENRDCVICLSDQVDQGERPLPIRCGKEACGRYMHRTCLQRWICATSYGDDGSDDDSARVLLTCPGCHVELVTTSTCRLLGPKPTPAERLSAPAPLSTVVTTVQPAVVEPTQVQMQALSLPSDVPMPPPLHVTMGQATWPQPEDAQTTSLANAAARALVGISMPQGEPLSLPPSGPGSEAGDEDSSLAPPGPTTIEHPSAGRASGTSAVPSWVDAGHTGYCPRAMCACTMAGGDCSNIYPVEPGHGLTQLCREQYNGSCNCPCPACDKGRQRLAAPTAAGSSRVEPQVPQGEPPSLPPSGPGSEASNLEDDTSDSLSSLHPDDEQPPSSEAESEAPHPEQRCQCPAICPWLPCPHLPEAGNLRCDACWPVECQHRCACKCTFDSRCRFTPPPHMVAPTPQSLNLTCVGPMTPTGPMVETLTVNDAMLLGYLRTLLYDIFDISPTVITELRLMPARTIVDDGFRLLYADAFGSGPVSDQTLAAARVSDASVVQLHSYNWAGPQLPNLPQAPDGEPPSLPPSGPGSEAGDEDRPPTPASNSGFPEPFVPPTLDPQSAGSGGAGATAQAAVQHGATEGLHATRVLLRCIGPKPPRSSTSHAPMMVDMSAKSTTSCSRLRIWIHQKFDIPLVMDSELRLMPGHRLVDEGFRLLTSTAIERNSLSMDVSAMTLEAANVPSRSLLQLYLPALADEQDEQPPESTDVGQNGESDEGAPGPSEALHQAPTPPPPSPVPPAEPLADGDTGLNRLLTLHAQLTAQLRALATFRDTITEGLDDAQQRLLRSQQGAVDQLDIVLGTHRATAERVAAFALPDGDVYHARELLHRLRGHCAFIVQYENRVHEQVSNPDAMGRLHALTLRRNELRFRLVSTHDELEAVDRERDELLDGHGREANHAAAGSADTLASSDPVVGASSATPRDDEAIQYMDSSQRTRSGGRRGPIERYDDHITVVAPAQRAGLSIGNGLFAAKHLKQRQRFAQFGTAAECTAGEWALRERKRSLPDWAAFELASHRRRGKAPKVYDSSWRHVASGQPKWAYMNHSKLHVNCRAVRTPEGSIAWETTRVVAQGEELVYDYAGFTEDWDEKERNAAADMCPPPLCIGQARGAGAVPARGPASDTPLEQEVHTHVGFTPVWATGAATGRDSTPRAAGAVVKLLINGTGNGTLPPAAAAAVAAAPPLDAPAQAFVPAWATSGTVPAPTATGKRPRHDQPKPLPPPADTSTSARHPYLRPAYGKSLLRGDQVQTAEELATRLARDRTAGRINAPPAQLRDMAMAVAEARADGINPRTASKDAFALREWTAFAEVSGFEPDLKTEWARRFPERESLKLASFLLWRAQRAIPRSRKGVAKPMSIYQNYLALRRVFHSRGVELTPPRAVRETLRGLLRRFIRRYGIDALRPKRVEPITPDIVRKCVHLLDAGRTTIKGIQWKRSSWTPFVVTGWMVINMPVGSRKGESTKLRGDVDENDWFNRAAVTAIIKGRTHVDPPTDVWESMAEGDSALLAPRGSKCDPTGSCHGTSPIVLPFHDDELNAARWIRDIEVRDPVRGKARGTTPLFADASGKPFNDGTFADLIMAVLTEVVGPTRAKLYSPHSWRVWLATSLRMAGASDARIQAMGRWLNPESIKIYARMTNTEYAAWVDRLMGVKRIDTARTTNLPVMDTADALASWGDELWKPGKGAMDTWAEPSAPTPPAAAPLKAGERVTVFWSDMNEWFSGTYKCSRVEPADGGGHQRASCIVYDAAGLWAGSTKTQLTFWHCLDDEHWQHADAAAQ